MLRVWQAEGWEPNGPGRCKCPGCGKTVSTNALARAQHRKSCERWQAIEIRAVTKKEPTS